MEANIVGEFDILQKSTLGHRISGMKMLVSERKHPTIEKPKYFLLLLSPTGERSYISSLFPDPNNKAENPLKRYFLDYQRVDYVMIQNLEARTVTITPLSGTPQNSANSINNAELGVKFTPK